MPKFERLERVIGCESLEKLKNSCVVVLGVGGVGGYVVEALARSGVGTLVLVDFDTVDETNINRQIIALESTIGMSKVDLFEERIKDINRDCNVLKIDKFIDKDNISILFERRVDFFVDACDSVQTKKEVIRKCLALNVDFISCMGTGNKLDPSKLEITELSKTVNDPLARIMRKFVRDEKIKGKIKVLSSSEVPVKMQDNVVGSTAFVPASAGLLIASYVVGRIIK